MELKQYIKKVLYENLPIEINFDLELCEKNIYKTLLNDNQKECFIDSSHWSASTLAIIYYRVASHIFQNYNLEFASFKISEIGFLKTNIYISPKCQISDGLKLELAENTKIYDKVIIGKNFVVHGGVVICSNTNSIDNRIVIGNNVEIKNGASIWGNCNVGDNVVISNNCVVQDDIESGAVVRIITTQQITTYQNKSIVPSQKLIVYGVVPKFKNRIVIYGEGFYNPCIDIKVKNNAKAIENEIMYWDKNTIILKIRSTQKINIDECNKNKIIIKCNGYKLILINSNIYKALNN